MTTANTSPIVKALAEEHIEHMGVKFLDEHDFLSELKVLITEQKRTIPLEGNT